MAANAMDTRRRAFSNPKYTDAFSPAFVYAMLGVVKLHETRNIHKRRSNQNS